MICPRPNLDKDMVFLASFLMHKDFALMTNNEWIQQFKFMFPKMQHIVNDYNEFLMGLCRTICYLTQEISINSLLQNYRNTRICKKTFKTLTQITWNQPPLEPMQCFVFINGYHSYFDFPLFRRYPYLMIILNYIEILTPFKQILMIMNTSQIMVASSKIQLSKK